MLNTAQLDYATVATKLSALLGRTWDVNVVLGGDPCTNGRMITLPHWNFQDPALRASFYGLIAHEAGGHVRQTDFNLLLQEAQRRQKGPNRSKFPIWKSIENILEDIRIERNIQREYPGATTYLNAAADYMLCRKEVDPTGITNYWELALGWCLLAFRCEYLGQWFLSTKVEQYQAVFAGIVKPEVIDAAHNIAKKVANLGPSKEEFAMVIECADLLFCVLDDGLPSNQPEKQSQQGDDDRDADADSGDQNDDDNAPGNQSGQSGQDGDDDVKGNQCGQNDQNPTENHGSKDQSRPDRPLDETPIDTPVGDIFAELMDAGKTEDQSVLHMPVVGSITTGPENNASADIVKSELRAGKAMSQSLIAAIAPILCGDTEFSTNNTSGTRLNSQRLARVATESDPTVFRKLLIEEDQSVAVQILIDRSKSTEGRCLSKIRTSALGLASALEQFQEVETSISAFPTSKKGSANLYGSQLIKQFDEPVLRSIGKWPKAHGGTPLADAYVSVAMNFFLSRKERRILIVITDGKPDCVSKAEEAKRSLRALGVEVYGVIVSNKPYPAQMFDDSEQIEQPQELPRRLAALVQRIL